MTAAIQDDLFAFLAVCDVLIPRPVHDTPAILHAVMTDPLPSRQTDREHIEAAIRAAAAEHGGFVTAAWVRPHITRDVLPQMVGAVLRARAGFLAPTERIAIKVNTIMSSAYWTPVPLVMAVAQSLQDAGIPAGQIIIFDRDPSELQNAGFTINRDGPGVHCTNTTDYPILPISKKISSFAKVESGVLFRVEKVYLVINQGGNKIRIAFI